MYIKSYAFLMHIPNSHIHFKRTYRHLESICEKLFMQLLEAVAASFAADKLALTQLTDELAVLRYDLAAQ